jgi:hypothetical protein
LDIGQLAGLSARRAGSGLQRRPAGERIARPFNERLRATEFAYFRGIAALVTATGQRTARGYSVAVPVRAVRKAGHEIELRDQPDGTRVLTVVLPE